MKVFKFGGGVLKSGKDAFKSAEILRLFEGQKIIVVISAFNKVTDKIER
ncbi:MAG: aspartate kinase, partial [Chlorobi bacterium]|nr:aspartate kinase [Chlorobiota bacterium]